MINHIKSGEHGFSFNASTVLTNTSFNIEKIIINFDDGYGDQELYPGGSSLGSSSKMGITNVFRAEPQLPSE